MAARCTATTSVRPGGQAVVLAARARPAGRALGAKVREVRERRRLTLMEIDLKHHQ
jgi:hypothetical protein